MSDKLDIEHLKSWVGKQMVEHDTITAHPYLGMSATMDIANASGEAGTALPPLWQWLYFLPTALASEIATDGHPKMGGFLPPIPLPLRMWAGGKFTFHKPLRLGDKVAKKSIISDIKLKEGAAGPLVFVTQTNEFSANDELAITDELQIVYRAPSDTPAKKPDSTAPKPVDGFDADWSQEITPDPVLLFRYSALTFNAHRIHFDRPYTTREEGYPGLLVHGPLTASMLSNMVQQNVPDMVISEFSCRAKAPLFDINNFTLEGKRDGDNVTLRAINHNGSISMEATAVLKDKS